MAVEDRPPELVAAEEKARISEAYKATFVHGNAPDVMPLAAIVLADLAKFCRINDTTITVAAVGGALDVNMMLIHEGQRRVFLRIAQALEIDAGELRRRAHDQARLRASEED